MHKLNKKLPRFTGWFLNLFIDRVDHDSLIGDFEEMYQIYAQDYGRFRASLWLWSQIIKSLPTFFINSVYWSAVMFKNYLKTAWRIFIRQKGYTFINIAGLSIGLACCILILVFVRYELSYDMYHEKAGQIYRITTETLHSGKPFHMAPTMLPLAPALLNEFAEVKYATRVSQTRSSLFSRGENQFYERIFHTEPSIFNIFTFPLLRGDPSTALSEPFSIVITKKLAEKYFGKDDPIGKILTINNTHDYKVTGILMEIPHNSHFTFEVLASFSSLENTERVKRNSWTSFSNDYTYIFLPQEINTIEFEKKFPAFLQKHVGTERNKNYQLHLQPLNEIHFSSLNYDFARTIDKKYLLAFSVIALFILFIACINFMNLATARSAGRVKEVGLRKVVGAHRFQLIKQFLAESVLMTLIALVVAIVLVKLILPHFGFFINIDLSFDLLDNLIFIGGLTGLSVMVGILSGSYPALFLSAYQPVKALRNIFLSNNKSVSFRTIFVVLQFTISIILIIATFVVYDQLNYMQNKDLGYDAEQIIVVPIARSPLQNKYESFKAAILQNPSIISASVSNGTPASGRTDASTYKTVGADEEQEIYLYTIRTDYDFIETMGIEVVQGRNFSKEYSTDAQNAYILNEAAVKRLNWDSPIGNQLANGPNPPGRVIGVVKDFHYQSTRSAIEPTVLTIAPSRSEYISVNVHLDNIAQTLTFLEAKWKTFNPKYPFEYFFIDKEFDNYFKFEQRLGRIFTLSALLAIFISCLGILGLIAYTAEQRTKEIGIRKVLGASVAKIVFMLSKEFVKWVLIANILAWPAAYFAMKMWLEHFPYRIEPGWFAFIISGTIALVIALSTVSYQAIKAAIANPVEALKYE